MKVIVEFKDDFIEKMAIEMYPDKVRYEKCCSGRDCGCQGGLDVDASDAIGELEWKLTSDKALFIEFVQEYDKQYTIE